MSNSCTERKLINFSKKHYTYINQIFGDISVREIIKEVYPNDKFNFVVLKANDIDNFENNSLHHVLEYVKSGRQLCSVQQKHQDLTKNLNDTLCQSYSLMNYFGIKISRVRRKKQEDMVRMYKTLLNNDEFVKKLNDDILTNKKNKKIWVDYSKPKKYLDMNVNNLVKNINMVLDNWNDYGYNYFIGDGDCK
tara:strand:- start:384 stop:959 length:576 start_codon:yes stop_codon:yes gene_type:complete